MRSGTRPGAAFVVPGDGLRLIGAGAVVAGHGEGLSRDIRPSRSHGITRVPRQSGGYRRPVERITIRGASSNLPVFTEDMELTPLSSLGRVTGQLSRFSLDDLSMRTLDVQDAGLHEGRIHNVHAENVSIRRVTVRSLKFSECNLSMLHWSGGEISTAWFDNCKLLGARFDDIKLMNVVFADCKIDYSTFSRMRTSGPVLFVRCSIREAEFEGCYFSRALFDECELVQTNFGHGSYKGCDLRGNDLSVATGINNLKSVVIDRYQLTQLAEAMASELNVTFGDDLHAG